MTTDMKIKALAKRLGKRTISAEAIAPHLDEMLAIIKRWPYCAANPLGCREMRIELTKLLVDTKVQPRENIGRTIDAVLAWIVATGLETITAERSLFP